jgi:uncharacterized protein (TIGR00725 family)
VAIQIAVIGAGEASPDEESAAFVVGENVAAAGAVVVCGGLGGVMEAACRGAKAAGGTTVGLLPGRDRSAANRWVDIVVPTGLSEARNVLVVGAAAAVVAVGGVYGTLSEIALALRNGTPVVGVGTWELRRRGAVDPGIVVVDDPVAAARLALELASAAPLR